MFAGSADTCLLLGSLANDAPYGRLCFQQPEMCDYGLSASVWVNFTLENYAKEVLLATSTSHSQGFQFYTDVGKLCLTVIGAKGRWHSCVDEFQRKCGFWRLLGFTWERSTGIIRIYIDSSVTTFYYVSTYSEPNSLAQPATEVRMGCEISVTVTRPASSSHLHAQAIHPALWLWPIHEENLILLTGALVYKLIKYQPVVSTPQPTSPSAPSFAYSTILKRFTYATTGPNPYYEMADFYLRAGVGMGALAPETASSNVTVTNLQRGDAMEAVFLIQNNLASLQWTNIGLIYDQRGLAPLLTLYVNGVQCGATASDASPTIAATFNESITIGSAVGGGPTPAGVVLNHLFFLGSDIQLRPTENSISWSGKCITDPYQRDCQISGLTVHAWMNIKSVNPSKMQFILNSGDFGESRSSAFDSRGISIFTTGNLLGASISIDRQDWTIVIDANRFGLNEWFNVGFTWNLQQGMRLFLNGTDYGIRNLQPDISYKAYDKHIRAVVGRFDNDQNSTWKDNPDWFMGNFSFTDIVFYDRWMTPEEFAMSVGSLNNRYYIDSDLISWGQAIIDTEFLLLKQAKLLSTPIGPVGNVSSYEAKFSKIGTNGQVGIKAFRAEECPRRLSSCRKQVIVTLWMKLLSKDSGADLTIISMGNEADPFEGFGMNISADGNLAAWVKLAGWTAKMVTKSNVKMRLNRWSNVALLLSKDNFFPTIILNGTNVSISLEYRESGGTFRDSTAAGALTVGKLVDPSAALGDSFLLFIVAAWYKELLTSSQSNLVLGIQSSQYDLLRLADDYWTVAGLWSKLQPKSLHGVNTDFGPDKYGTENGALCTLGTGGSYVIMENSQGQLSLQYLELQVVHFNASGQNPGSIGTAVALTRDAFVQVTVRSPNRTCTASAPFNYSTWVSLQVFWYASASILLKADDYIITYFENASTLCWNEDNDIGNYTAGLLGRPNDKSKNAAAACFSDIMLKYLPLGSADELSTDLDANCYDRQTIHVPMHSAGNSNHANEANRSRRFVAAESVDLGTEVCLFSGSGCPKGFTISLWLQIQSISTEEYVDVLRAGYPSNQGLRIRAKKKSASSNIVKISVELSIAGKLSQVTLGDSSIEQKIHTRSWFNLAVSVTKAVVELYLNGVQVVASTQFSSENLAPSTVSNAVLGSPSAVMLMSDLVFWNEPPIDCLDPPKNKKLLTDGTSNESLATSLRSFSRAFSAVMQKKFADQLRPQINSGKLNPAAMLGPIESLALRLAGQLPTACSSVTFTQGLMHWSTQLISSSCIDRPVDALRYTEQTHSLWMQSTDTVLLPISLFTSLTQAGTEVKVACVVYNHVSDLLPNDATNETVLSSATNGSIVLVVNSRVVSIKTSIPVAMTRKMEQPVNLTLQLFVPNIKSQINKEEMQLETRCVFWDPRKAIVARDKKLHNELYILYLNLAGAIFIGQLSFLLTGIAKQSDEFCKAVSIVMHLFFVAGLAMLLAASIWLFHAVVKGVIIGRLKWLLPIAWILPVVIVAVVAGVSFQSFGYGPQCWLDGIYIWSFLGPLLLFGLLSILVTLIVLCNLSQQAIKRRDIQTELKHQSHECALLAPLLTAAWLFAVPQTLWYTLPVQYVFVILNACQGFFVLLCLGLLNWEFREAAIAMLCCGTVHRHTRVDLNSSNVSVVGIQDIMRDNTTGYDQWTAGDGPSSAEVPVYHNFPRPGRDEVSTPTPKCENEGNYGSRRKLRDSTKSVAKKN
uniref:G_PROTEIN_RECEP_F2_4 domain-containing protein n=1 Tax=Macrostomum lignano TaxID=282301 RepID=A0A1I8FY11_9PLAT